ncbi:hypothetical protein T310_8272, partial [Rasamsonia emersonii CBS 393.64]
TQKGSLQRPRKRLRESRTQTEKLIPARSPSQENPETTENPASDPSGPSPNGRCSCDKGSSPSGRERASPKATTETDEWSTRRRDSQLNIHDLSFILHPSHEASTPEKEQNAPPSRGVIDQEPVLIARACSALGVTQEILKQMVKIYFDNMVAINLFHEPSFREKVNGIASTAQVHALLAALLAYAARFYPAENSDGTDHAFGDTAETHLQAGYFLNLAFSNIDDALKECGDEGPPLCVLQALIVATHCQLTQGVRGKAWRSLGTCIRLAYELNLHLVDAGSGKDLRDVDVQQWCDDEEKRRAWWAIWEMDVFASTIRRTPPAVDWSQMETLLPVEDQDWFQNKPRPSCFMERDPIYRWKALQECGNQSPKAWFLVVNSLMKEAQVISSPRSVPYRYPPDENQPPCAANRRPKQARDRVEEATQKLETLANSVHCFTLALPAHLQYRNQYLSFDARAPGQMLSLRQLHCSIYNIYVMTQLAKLMIYRYDVFGGRSPTARRTHDSLSAATAKASPVPRSSSASNGYDAENLVLAQYFEAADNILTIINRSSDGHIRYINPFLSSTIWLASAVQLLRKEFSRDEISRTLIKSKFEVLYMTYKRCVSFWDIHTALQQNLEALETKLEGFRNPDHGSQEQPSDSSVKIKGRHAGEDSQARYEPSYLQMNGDQMDTGTDIVHGESSEQTGSTNVRYTNPSFVSIQKEASVTDEANCGYSSSDGPPPPPPPPAALQTPPPSVSDDGPQPQGRTSHQQPLSGALQKPPHGSPPVQNFPSGTPNMSMLDYMHLPSQVDRQPTPTGDNNTNKHNRPSPGTTLIDPLFLLDPTPQPPRGLSLSTDGVNSTSDFGQHPDWRNIELPSDIHDLLSGFSTY